MGVGDDGGEVSEASGVIMYFVQLCTVSSCNIFSRTHISQLLDK